MIKTITNALITLLQQNASSCPVESGEMSVMEYVDLYFPLIKLYGPWLEKDVPRQRIQEVITKDVDDGTAEIAQASVSFEFQYQISLYHEFQQAFFEIAANITKLIEQNWVFNDDVPAHKQYLILLSPPTNMSDGKYWHYVWRVTIKADWDMEVSETVTLVTESQINVS